MRVQGKIKMFQSHSLSIAVCAISMLFSDLAYTQGRPEPAPLTVPDARSGADFLLPRFRPQGHTIDMPTIRADWLADGERALQECQQVGQLLELGLEDAIETALCNNPKVKVAWFDVKVKLSNVGEARAPYFPIASLSGTRGEQRSWVDNPILGSDRINSQSAYANINWRIFDFGERSGNLQSAKNAHAAALAAYHGALYDTRKTVIAAYFEMLSAWLIWSTQQSKEQLARQTLQVLKRRLANGAASIAEVARALSALASTAQERNRAKGAYDKATLALSQSLGLPVQNSLNAFVLKDAQTCMFDAGASEPDGRCEEGLQGLMQQPINAHEFVSGMGQSLADILSHVRSTHPSITAARAQIQAIRDKAISARAAMLPRVDLVSNYFRNGSLSQGLLDNNSSRVVAGVTLTIPVFDGLGAFHRTQALLREAEKSEAELEGIEIQLLNELIKAHSDVTVALTNLDASIQLWEAAQTSLASSQRRYDRGEADALELLNAQMSMADARQERGRSVAEWHSARLQLLAMAGVLESGLLRVKSSVP